MKANIYLKNVVVFFVLFCAGFCWSELTPKAMGTIVPEIVYPSTVNGDFLCYNIDARLRNGNTGFEAVLFTPGDPSPGNDNSQLNPAGAPAWNYNLYYNFELSYFMATGTSTWSIDFNRDGDYLDPEESTTSISPDLAGKCFVFMNIYGQGNSNGLSLDLQDFTINGNNLGSFISNSETPFNHTFENSNGIFTDIIATGSVRLSGNGGSERPRLWVRAGNCMTQPKAWNGTVNSDWNTPGNWAENTIPCAADNVIIPVGSSTTPVLSAGQVYQCNDLVISTDGNNKAYPPSAGLVVKGIMNVKGNLVIPTDGSITIPADGAMTVDKDLFINGEFLVEEKGSLITNGTTFGYITFQRYIPNDMSWHLLSSPVGGQAICDGVFAPTFPGTFPGDITTWDFYNWLPNCPTPPTPPEHWRNLRSTTGSVNTVDFPGLTFWVGRGYLVAYGTGWPTTKNFVGPPNCCSQVCTFYDIEDECSWALPGNPFPASLDWSKITGKSNLVADYYYIWNESKSGGSGYEFWKDDSHHSSSMVNGYIPSMQGFFVKVDPYGGLTLTIPGEARSHHSATWLKSETTPVNKLTLKLSNGVNYDEAFVLFENEAKTGKDRSDAEKLFTLNKAVPQIYTLIDNDQKTALNSIPFISDGTTIPVGILPPAEGTYNISVQGIESFSSIQGLSIEDLKLNYTHNLLLDPVYTFTTSGIEDASRFLLHFSGPIGIGEKNNSLINIYASEKTIFITSAAGFQNAHITVCNLLGQEILSQKLSDQNINKVSVNTMKGYYIVKVQNETTVKTAKVYIN